MRFQLTPALATRVSKGDAQAIATLVNASYRTVHNLFFKVTGDKGRSKELTRKAFVQIANRLTDAVGSSLPWSAWLLDLARDVAFESLPGDLYRDTLFVKARDLVTEPVELPGLTREFLDRDEMWGQEFDTGFKTALTPSQLLVLELIFIERCPLGHLSEVLGVSEHVLASFVYSVFDMLGEMAQLEHQPTCTPDIFLGIKIVDLQADPEGLARLEAQHSGCLSCVTVIRRCLKIVRLFSIDSRIALKPDESLFAELAAPQARKAAPVVAPPPIRPLKSIPKIPVHTPEGAGTRASRLVAAGTILAIFTWASFKMVDMDRLRGRPVVLDEKRPGARTLGFYSNPFASNQPIHPDAVVYSAKNHKTDVTLENGVQLLLHPDSSVRFRAGEAVILKGLVGLLVPKGLRLAVSNERATGTVGDGEFLVDRNRGVRTRFSVSRGELSLVCDGTTYRVEALRQATVDEVQGKVSVVDLKDRELAGLRSSLPTASPLMNLPFGIPGSQPGGMAGGSSFPGSGPAAGARDRGHAASSSDPAAGPSARPWDPARPATGGGGGGNPRGARGYKDFF